MTFAPFGEPFVAPSDGVDSADFVGDGVAVSFDDESVAVRLEGALLLPRGDGGNAIRGVDCCGVPLSLGDLLEAKADALRCSPFGRPLRLSPRPPDVTSGVMICHAAARALSAVDLRVVWRMFRAPRPTLRTAQLWAQLGERTLAQLGSRPRGARRQSRPISEGAVAREGGERAARGRAEGEDDVVRPELLPDHWPRCDALLRYNEPERRHRQRRVRSDHHEAAPAEAAGAEAARRVDSGEGERKSVDVVTEAE